MSGISPLIDTMLATRLAQRADLIPLKGALEITDPEGAAKLEAVTNDVRVPSRAAQQQSVGQLLADSAGDSKGSPLVPAAPANANVTLSAVARTLSSLLEPAVGTGSPILGVKPLWPHAASPTGSQLTAVLSRTVEYSGLFYESHLSQLVVGTRTLAQMMQEPQARLPAMSPYPADTPGAAVVDPVQGGVAMEDTSTHAVELMDTLGPPTTVEKSDASNQEASRGQPPAPAGIHANALTLVRQQLDLMAVPVFRWVGDAWPGTSMDWEIHQEQGDRTAHTATELGPPTWRTRFVIDLPALKAVDVRLSIAGDQLQVHLVAMESATQALLVEARKELSACLSALGLKLNGVQIGEMAQASVASALSQKADDAVA